MARGKYLTMDEKRALQAAYEAGESYMAVAVRMGRAASTTFQAYQKAARGLLVRPYVKGRMGEDAKRHLGASITSERRPWKPGDPKPDFLKRGQA